LFLKVEVSGESAPINVFSIEMGGRFQVKEKPAAEKIGEIAEINCAAIVFPFAREVIADLTRRSGLPPFLLPPINFVEFYKTNHAGQFCILSCRSDDLRISQNTTTLHPLR
jgi:preprotein translocase subunit SecB